MPNNNTDDSDLFEWDDEPAAQDDDDSALETEVASFTTTTEVAELPDGAGHVILSGPGAGTTVAQAPDGLTRAEFPIRGRDAALTSGSPLFLVHFPHQKRDLMPRLLASVVAATRGRVSTAAAVALPRGTDTALAGWIDSCPAASVRIADPLGYMLDPTIVRIPKTSDRALGWRPYLGEDTIDAAALVDMQRQVGANLLLSSGRALDSAEPQEALNCAFSEGDDALAALESDERLALNLTLTTSWLSNAALREKLFSQLLDQEQFDTWHIRVQWQSSLRSFHQPTDMAFLAGYKRLAQLAKDEGRTLLLPQTGLTGWLQLAFGSTGYGAGLFGSGHAFKEHSRGGNGAIPEVERYFEPTLLHIVERAVHDAMRARADYVHCDCPYCPALHARPDWDHTLAHLHMLHWVGRLGGIASPTRPIERAIRQSVRDAVRTADGEPLAGVNVPRHLPVWDQLL